MSATCVPWYVPCGNTGLSKHGDPVFPQLCRLTGRGPATSPTSNPSSSPSPATSPSAATVTTAVPAEPADSAAKRPQGNAFLSDPALASQPLSQELWPDLSASVRLLGLGLRAGRVVAQGSALA